MATPSPSVPAVSELLKRRLLFISGKGGVGKTAVSQAIAETLSRDYRTLWVAFEDPTRPPGELKQVQPKLWHLNCEASTAFEEYAGMKIGVNALTQVFLRNKVIRYLAKAAPGIHELVLLGKVWFERTRYDRVIVDMPSTGYGLAMFQSTKNFTQLFKNGPLFKDAIEMLATFNDPAQTGQIIVALPEEMPLVESLELDEFLISLFPANRAGFVVNRRFPDVTTSLGDPDTWPTPFAADVADYAEKRAKLETHNLEIWQRAGVTYSELPMIAPAASDASAESPGSEEALVHALAERISAQGWGL